MVICVEDIDGEKVVTVAPITHTKPEDLSQAIELTPATRRRLGLDAQKNWILATEVNTFFWPGPDLAQNQAGSYEYGELPAVVFNALKIKILAADSVSSVKRSE